MPTTYTVTGPHENGQYWQAEIKSMCGARKRRGLGPKAKLSRRAAVTAVRELQREIDAAAASGRHVRGMPLVGLVPGAAQPAAGMRGSLADLRVLCERRDESRGVAKGTAALHANTWDSLLGHWGDETLCRSITPGMADEWSLAKLGHLSESTRTRYHRDARLFWSVAMGEGWHAGPNPFERLRKTVAAASMAERAWGSITSEQVAAVVDAAEGPWRVLVALCAYAGLRRGEALALRWCDVRADRLHVVNAKTRAMGGAASRAPRLEPELAAVLDAARGGSSGSLVVGLACSTGHLHRKMTGYDAPNGGKHYDGIMESAGVAWPRPYHTLRKWRRMTWEQVYPLPVVDAWLGHSAKVGADHYSAVPEGLYE